MKVNLVEVLTDDGPPATLAPLVSPIIVAIRHAAFAAWLTGDGAQALVAVERALRADPDYSMAQIVLDVLEQGVSPVLWDGLVTPAGPSSDPR